MVQSIYDKLLPNEISQTETKETPENYFSSHIRRFVKLEGV